MTEETGQLILGMLTNIDALNQNIAGGIWAIVGVLISATIAIIIGGWLRDC